MRESHTRARLWRRLLEVLVAAGLILGLPMRVAAQTAEPAAHPTYGAPPRAPFVPVVLHGDRPHLKLALSLTREHRPFAQCVGACMVYVAPGDYWLSVSGPGVIEGERELDIEWPSRVLVHPRSESGRRTGLTLGILGIGLIGVGTATYLAAESRSDTSEGSIALLGVASAIAGAILTPIGWTKYARSSPNLEVVSIE